MPTYEYRCPKGHEFERFQRMSDDPVADCPTCGKEAERLLSAGAGFLFKGDGFYITDYRSESYRKAAKAEKGGGNDTKKESKGGEASKGKGGSASQPKKGGTAGESGSTSGSPASSSSD